MGLRHADVVSRGDVGLIPLTFNISLQWLMFSRNLRYLTRFKESSDGVFELSSRKRIRRKPGHILRAVLAWELFHWWRICVHIVLAWLLQ